MRLLSGVEELHEGDGEGGGVHGAEVLSCWQRGPWSGQIMRSPARAGTSRRGPSRNTGSGGGAVAGRWRADGSLSPPSYLPQLSAVSHKPDGNAEACCPADVERAEREPKMSSARRVRGAHPDGGLSTKTIVSRTSPSTARFLRDLLLEPVNTRGFMLVLVSRSVMQWREGGCRRCGGAACACLPSALSPKPPRDGHWRERAPGRRNGAARESMRGVDPVVLALAG